MPKTVTEYYKLRRYFSSLQLEDNSIYDLKHLFENIALNDWNHQKYDLVPKDCNILELFDNYIIENHPTIKDAKQITYFESEEEFRRYQKVLHNNNEE